MEFSRRAILKFLGLSTGRVSALPVADETAHILASLPAAEEPASLFGVLTQCSIDALDGSYSLVRADDSDTPPGAFELLEQLSGIYRHYARIRQMETAGDLQPIAERANRYIDTYREQLVPKGINNRMWCLPAEQQLDYMTLKAMNPAMEPVTPQMLVEYFGNMVLEEARFVLDMASRIVGSERAQHMDHNAQHVLPKEMRAEIARKHEAHRRAVEEYECSREHPLVKSFRERFATDLEERDELSR